MLDAFIIEKIRRREPEARERLYAPVPTQRPTDPHGPLGPEPRDPRDTRPEDDAVERGIAIIDFTI